MEVSIQASAIDQCAEKAVVARILHPRAYWNATDGPWGYSNTCVLQCVQQVYSKSVCKRMRVIDYGRYALRVTVLRHYYMHYIGLL